MFWSSRIRCASSSARRQSHITALPNIGSPTGTSTRTQPAPWQIGHGGSAPCDGALGLGTVRSSSTSPSRAVVFAFGRPALEDTLDVSPAPSVVGDSFSKGILNPLSRVQPLRRTQLVGEKRGEKPDVLLVEIEDIRPGAPVWQ